MIILTNVSLYFPNIFTQFKSIFVILIRFYDLDLLIFINISKYIKHYNIKKYYKRLKRKITFPFQRFINLTIFQYNLTNSNENKNRDSFKLSYF